MIKKSLFVAAISLAAMIFAGSAAAKPALKDVEYVRDGIIHVGMAYEIGERCSSINARRWRGINFLYSLQNHAKALGYTQAEINAYTNDREEKRRLEAIARANLAALGVVEGEEATYCNVGRDQIAAGTQVGRLLR